MRLRWLRQLQGRDDRHCNDVLLLQRSEAPPLLSLIAFPGDIQDEQEVMERSAALAPFVAFSLEQSARTPSSPSPPQTTPGLRRAAAAAVVVVVVAETLGARFVCDSVLVVKAAEHVGPHELARYVNFADCDAMTAAARYEPWAGRANSQLDALLSDADRRVPTCVGAELVLCAFSRGAVVLNQLVCELGHGEQRASQLWKRVKRVVWLDAGNGCLRGAFPGPEIGLSGEFAKIASANSMQLHIEMTPYQLECRQRPWIAKERDRFVQWLREHGLPESQITSLTKNFSDRPGSIESHFRVLKGC